MADAPSPVIRAGLFLRDLVVAMVVTVIITPVRRGTLDLRHHRASIAAIAIFVAVVYASVMTAILLANPLRSASDLVSAVTDQGIAAVPSFLLPATFLLLSLAMALILAGSQRAAWWLRLILLVTVTAILALVVIPSRSASTGGVGSWLAVVTLVGTVAYAVVVWSRRTRVDVDFLVFWILTGGTMLLAYRGFIDQLSYFGQRLDLVTAAVLLWYLTVLAAPVAFLSGFNATAFGVSIVDWGARYVAGRVRRLAVLACIVVVLVWQVWVVISGWLNAAADAGTVLLDHLGAIILVCACGAAWLGISRRPATTDSPPVGAAALRVVVPIAYALMATAIINAVLGLVQVVLSAVRPGVGVDALAAAMEVMASTSVVRIDRLVVVIACGVAAVLLASRGRQTLALVLAIDAIVLTMVFIVPSISALEWLHWTPEAVSDLGLVIVAGLLAWFWLRRELTHERVHLLLGLALLAALVRQADFFALPIGFLIGASTIALLLFGLTWGFLTDGSSVHVDSAHQPRDARLLLLLGQFLFGITIVSWAVIGKQVEAMSQLSQLTSASVASVGTALILATAFGLLSSVRTERRGAGA